MYTLGRGGRRSVNIWPGFVDALATLLLVVVFVLMVFMISQYFLSTALSGRDEALTRLERDINDLAELLSLERSANAELRIDASQLSSELQSSLSVRETLANQLAALTETRDEIQARLAAAEASGAKVSEELEDTFKELEDTFKVIEADKEKIQAQLQDLAILQSLRDDLIAKLARTESDAEAQKQLGDEAQAQVQLLNRQIFALRRQLASLATALEVAETANKEQDVQIANLGRRLNVALASKVQELARYRSEFFGRLREVLGTRKDVRIVGDRFVFQSEVLFETGSAALGEAGQRQLGQLARTLTEIAVRIPKNLPWVLRVDGHTDRIPINTPEFPSNWELSTARAISVVKFLIDQGISADHLAATGFGEHQPLDPGLSEEALRRNRRIELKLTQR